MVQSASPWVESAIWEPLVRYGCAGAWESGRVPGPHGGWFGSEPVLMKAAGGWRMEKCAAVRAGRRAATRVVVLGILIDVRVMFEVGL